MAEAASRAARRGVDRLALGAQGLAAGIANLGAGAVELVERVVELLATSRVRGGAAHGEDGAAREFHRAFGEGVVDLALDGLALLGRGAFLVVLDEVEGRDEDRQRDDDGEAAEDERPPGRAVEEVGEGFHGVGFRGAPGRYPEGRRRSVVLEDRDHGDRERDHQHAEEKEHRRNGRSERLDERHGPAPCVLAAAWRRPRWEPD